MSLKTIFRNASYAGVGALLTSSYAFAQQSALVTAADNAIDGAGADALTVGGYVVAAVAGLVVVSLILGMVRKL